MKLVCPHCAKLVDVAPHLAGQITPCPLCAGPFTVPNVPPEVLAAMAGPAVSTVPPPPAPPAPPLPLLPSPTPSPGLKAWFRLDTAWTVAEPWLAPAAFLTLLVCLFFPWVGVYAGATMLVEQTGLGTGFGWVALGHDVKLSATSMPAAFVVLHALAVAAAAAIVAALLVLQFTPESMRKNWGSWQQTLRQQREFLLMVLGVVSAAALLLNLLTAFPLEAEMASEEKAASVLKEGLKHKVGADLTNVKVISADMVPLQWTQRRGWFWLAVVVNLAAAAVTVGDWLRQRGRITHWPELRVEWKPFQSGQPAERPVAPAPTVAPAAAPSEPAKADPVAASPPPPAPAG